MVAVVASRFAGSHVQELSFRRSSTRKRPWCTRGDTCIHVGVAQIASIIKIAKNARQCSAEVRRKHIREDERISSKSSVVWKYLDEPNEDWKVLCKLCETKLSFVGSTSVMHNHLMVKHPSSAAVAETDESDGERPQLRKQPSIMQAFAITCMCKCHIVKRFQVLCCRS